MTTQQKRRLRFPDFQARGWFNSRQQLHNAIKNRNFPRPRKRWPGRMSDPADWDQDECEAWWAQQQTFIEPTQSESA